MPFFGNTLESFFRDIRDVDLGRPEKFGPVYGLFMGTIPVLTVCDPEIVKHIAIKDAQNFTDVNAFRMRQKVVFLKKFSTSSEEVALSQLSIGSFINETNRFLSSLKTASF